MQKIDEEWYSFENCGGEEPDLLEGHILYPREGSYAKLLVLSTDGPTILGMHPSGHTRELLKKDWLDRWEVIAYVSVKDHLQDQINRLHGVLVNQCKNPLDNKEEG